MNLSVGLIDRLLGERVTLNVPRPDGEIVERQVKKLRRKMEAEQRMSQVQENVVFVRILDPTGDSLQRWTIGEDFESEIVDQWLIEKPISFIF